MVAYAVGHAFWRHQQIAGAHGQLAALQQEDAFALDHVVDLVHPRMRVQGM